ncbi:MAG: hypothetical protein CMH35_08670 [Microbacterium sp.]|uniref:hypothetical protein n=1 Tax=Microbacterium sp. UBA3394 TaxID=1946945 RepID=UPI000C397EDD|nr:hypothetical protein [Microbacterium sp. UBA3394]MAM54900.1 hypothetical protein [Microbacterium sp.]|tara:strand:+ start:2484 stop:3248 length:765 start_codon:yes stop_codon:yes gene_type:complete
MNTTRMSPEFATAFRARLVDHVTTTAQPRRRRRVLLTGGLALTLALGGTAAAAATGLLPLPGGTMTTDLSAAVSGTFAGTGALPLGERPADATGVAVSLTCLTPGTFTFDDGASVTCTTIDDTTRPTTYTVPVDAITGNQVTIATTADAVWSLTATWVHAATNAWAVNDNGFTYGVINDNGEPDLIAVVTTDGQPGYVWQSDLNDANGTTAAESFTSPEEALRWQEQNAGTVHHIPVYESDGTTQIGVFQVGGN